MSRLNDEQLLAAIRDAGGSSDLRGLRAALPAETSRRTLQRRLAALTKAGRLERVGATASLVYRLVLAPPIAAPPIATPPAAAPPLATPALSTIARDLLDAVRRPLQWRPRVGYQRAFLDTYQPNVSAYLPASLRTKLAELGRVPGADAIAGTYARRILDRLLIDLSWNSSRLEGNTYSILETDRLLATGEGAEGRDPAETQMLLNHKAAIEFLVDPGGVAFDRITLLNLHALLSENLIHDLGQVGSVRTNAVGIRGSSYVPETVPQLIEEHFTRIVTSGAAITDPFEQAFFAMVHLPYLQPFADVNKRVSRLAANIPLVRGNLRPLSFIDTPRETYVAGLLAIYELNRVELLRDVFEWSYERSCEKYSEQRQVIGEPDQFRSRYRKALGDVVADVIRGRLDKAGAAIAVREASRMLPDSDRARFTELAERELLSLRAGNAARFRVTPREFDAWFAGWR